jgi:tripartite-type tricarboxylate transporter receptor subunit TctC
MAFVKGSMLLVAMALLSGNVLAQSYPTKPVRIVVPYTPGGTVDIVARMIGERLTETLGRTFVVDNRAGASGNIGAELVAKAPPDGYTLLMSSAAPLAANPAVYPDLRFQPLRDFAPIALIVIQPNILVVNPSVPARTVGELVALAKARPGVLNYGSAGVGNSQHMAAELFRSYTNVNITHVPYKGGGHSRSRGRQDRSPVRAPTGHDPLHPIRPPTRARRHHPGALRRFSGRPHDRRDRLARLRVPRLDRTCGTCRHAAGNREYAA